MVTLTSAGLFDLQVNGFAGVDFNDDALTPDALDHALHAMAHTGVTHCLPTLITAPEAVLAERLHALSRAVSASRLGAAMVPGFHLEGPFLNPEPGYAGCHPADAMVPPDPALLHRLAAIATRPILLLTLAPERPGAGALMRAACALGMRIAIGHSAATAADIAKAVAAGACLSTHLGNALPRPAHKFDNPLMLQLAEDALSASVIADGIHLPPHALKVMLRAKDADRVILVTDAIAAAAAPPGPYGFAGMAIEHAADGSARLAGTATLAGSALCLDQAIRNIVTWGLLPPRPAIALAADTPRRLMQPALDRFGLRLPTSCVTWSGDLHPIRVTVGEHAFSPPR